jgi:spore coat protein CotH
MGGSLGGTGGTSGAGGSGSAAPLEYAQLFDEAALPQFDLELSAEAIAALGADPYTYQHGVLKYAGQTYSDVGIRLKGRTSAQGFDQKPAFKIKLNEFVKGQKLLGLKRLTLNNMSQDPTLMHERLGYSYYRALGLLAPRANHAKVYVNGQFYGVYLNLQSLDDVFVKEHFPGTEVGNLFDITNYDYFIDFDRALEPPAQETKFVLETNETPPDISDLTALIDAVSSSTDDTFLANTEAKLNLDEVLSLGAAQAVIADWDGYFGARNNFKAYHDTASDRFVLFPWGIDQSFNPLLVDYAIDHSQSERPRSIVYDRCAVHPECLARYRAEVQAASTKFESLPLVSWLDTWQAQIQAAVELDTRQIYTPEQRTQAVQELHGFVQARAAKVNAQLAP